MDRKVKRQWIDVPRDLLRANRADAVIVLRLGAFANAVQASVVRMVSALEERDSPASDRDRFILFLVAAGYMKESVDHIQKSKAGLQQLLNLARKSGYPLQAKWTEMEDLLTTKPGSVYDRILRRVRHDLAFHFEEDTFEKWVDASHDTPNVYLWEVDGTTNAGRLYRASSDALAFDLAEGKEGDDPSVRDALGAIRDTQIMLMRVAEAALIGFLIAAGRDPREFFGVEMEES